MERGYVDSLGARQKKKAKRTYRTRQHQGIRRRDVRGHLHVARAQGAQDVRCEQTRRERAADARDEEGSSFLPPRMRAACSGFVIVTMYSRFATTTDAAHDTVHVAYLHDDREHAEEQRRAERRVVRARQEAAGSGGDPAVGVGGDGRGGAGGT